MSEQKPETKLRTVAEINREYTQLAFRAGTLHYQIDALGRDLALITETMRDLNFEAAASNAKEAEEKMKAAKAAKQPAPATTEAAQVNAQSQAV